MVVASRLRHHGARHWRVGCSIDHAGRRTDNPVVKVAPMAKRPVPPLKPNLRLSHLVYQGGGVKDYRVPAPALANRAVTEGIGIAREAVRTPADTFPPKAPWEGAHSRGVLPGVDLGRSPR